MTSTPLADIASEQAVLGAMMLTPAALDRGLELLNASDFYSVKHQGIFTAISDLEQRGQNVDAITVAARLTETGTPTEFGELVSMSTGTPAAVNVDTYAKTVTERSLARRVTTAAHDATASLQGGVATGPEAASQLAETLYALELGDGAEHALTLKDISERHLDTIFEELLNPDHIIGYETGITDLDNLIGGLRPGTLTVIGARPSMGKSVLGLTIAHHQAAVHNSPTLLASLEMSHSELYSRLLAGQAKVSMRRRPLSQQDLAKLSNVDADLQDIPLTIDATASISIGELRAKAKRVKRRSDGELSMIIVDYIQLMSVTKAEARYIEVAELSRGLKALAVDLNCAVIALAQLSRALESRHDKRPLLSDLRESGAIEQDADNVIFIYRDDVYDPQSPDKGIAELLVRKARNGPTGTVRVAWLPQYPAFANMQQHSLVHH